MGNKFPLFWIGIRESEIIDTGTLFTGSITIFGSGKGTNYSFDKDYNYRFDYNKEFDNFDLYLNEKALEIIQIYPSCKFLLYYSVDINIVCSEVLERIVCVNDIDIINLLEDKINTRMWLSDLIPLPPFIVEYGENISYKKAKEYFLNYNQFVIQADYSCGGSGTWIFDDKNMDIIKKRINANDKYTISPLLSNSISINTHIIIYNKSVLLLPPSIQLINLENYCFSYKGADFIAYQYLPEYIRKKSKIYASKIGERLRKTGYRGVIGIDFIADEAEVYFMEINARFQSSTFLINKAFRQANLDISVQQLHINAFEYDNVYIPQELHVNYSFYNYAYNVDTFFQIKYLYNRFHSCESVIECIDDSLNWNMDFDANTYLFKIIFNTNISALSQENNLLVQSNIYMNNKTILTNKNWRNHLWKLKIMLFSHGIRVNENAEKKLIKQGGINYEEFEALDLIIENQFYISVPYLTAFSQLSPFEICLDKNGKFFLSYYEKKLAYVNIRTYNKMGLEKTKSGLLYEDISYMGYDRLRIYYRNGCYYKTQNHGCKFCDIENNCAILPLEDLKEIVDVYLDYPNLKHYLIGGGSDCPNSDFKKIVKIAQYIKEKSSKPIYLMSTPPKDTRILGDLYKSGITEVSFNLEVFDRNFAQKYMPGKGTIPIQVYENAFREAVKIWGNTGNVRSIFIVGLEPEESLLKGVKYVCEMGVVPILSLLKPIQSTELHYMLPPSDTTILHICMEAQKICASYGLELGPACHFCEDNSLKITY